MYACCAILRTKSNYFCVRCLSATEGRCVRWEFLTGRLTVIQILRFVWTFLGQQVWYWQSNSLRYCAFFIFRGRNRIFKWYERLLIPVATLGLWRGFAASPFLGLWVWIPPLAWYLSVVSVVCCQVEVSMSSWSRVQRSPTECGVFEYDRKPSTERRSSPTVGRLVIINIYTEWRKKKACCWICLRFLSLGLPQIKSLRLKTSYSRRFESFHSRRNCNCAKRNVSKCDAELWGEAPDMCTARRTLSFRYNFP